MTASQQPIPKSNATKRPLWKRGLNYLNNRRIRYSPRNLAIRAACLSAYARRKRHEKRFTILSEADFQATRTSERIFIFGSGTSLHDISAAEWAHMSEHNTMGFTLFTYQQFIRVDYHLIRELQIGYELKPKHWRLWYRKFTEAFDSNPHFKDSILIAQDGWSALVSNRMIGLQMLKSPRRMLPFKATKRINAEGQYPAPTRSLAEGVAHGSGTVTDCINIAAIGGWRHIILVGVDLYGKSYFYDTDQHQKPEQTQEKHGTVRTGIIQNLAEWHEILAQRGQQLWVYNPLSLLTEVLPLYDPQKIEGESDGR